MSEVVIWILFAAAVALLIFVAKSRYDEIYEYEKQKSERDRWQFKPYEDITAFELSRCVKIILDFPHIPNSLIENRIQREGTSVSRHWLKNP